MAFRTYKIPVGSATLPSGRVGPPAYEPPTLSHTQGTNLDYTELTFLHDGDGGYTRNQGFFLRVPVPHTYLIGKRKLRLRWKSTGTTGNGRWKITHEPYKAGSTWDSSFSGGPDVVDTAAPASAGDLAESLIELTGTAWAAKDEAILYVERESA